MCVWHKSCCLPFCLDAAWLNALPAGDKGVGSCARGLAQCTAVGHTNWVFFFFCLFFLSCSALPSLLWNSCWPYVVAPDCVAFKPLTSFAAINYNYHIKRQSVLIFNYKFFFSPPSAPLLLCLHSGSAIHLCVFCALCGASIGKLLPIRITAEFRLRFSSLSPLTTVHIIWGQRLLYDAWVSTNYITKYA